MIYPICQVPLKKSTEMIRKFQKIDLGKRHNLPLHLGKQCGETSPPVKTISSSEEASHTFRCKRPINGRFIVIQSLDHSIDHKMACSGIEVLVCDDFAGNIVNAALNLQLNTRSYVCFCSAPGQYSKWSAWSKCSGPCDRMPLMTSRIRTCNLDEDGNNECSGPGTDVRHCQKKLGKCGQSTFWFQN